MFNRIILKTAIGRDAEAKRAIAARKMNNADEVETVESTTTTEVDMSTYGDTTVRNMLSDHLKLWDFEKEWPNEGIMNSLKDEVIKRKVKATKTDAVKVPTAVAAAQPQTLFDLGYMVEDISVGPKSTH